MRGALEIGCILIILMAALAVGCVVAVAIVHGGMVLLYG